MLSPKNAAGIVFTRAVIERRFVAVCCPKTDANPRTIKLIRTANFLIAAPSAEPAHQSNPSPSR